MKELKGPFGESLEFRNSLPLSILKTKNAYWFVDSHFKNHKRLKKLENVSFLNAGEQSKTLEVFEKNCRTLLKNKANRSTTIFCVGGGSLGDSIGFLSSVYMRGLKFVSVPTTWLAAVDSSVGGKTALNGFGFKNVMGSFFPPQKIIFVKELIETSDPLEAKGEVFKTLILNHNKTWTKKILNRHENFKMKFSDLALFVRYKSRIVKSDPKDLNGKRAVLNFGHSLGHALELELKLSHGEAVKQGCLFALEWSHKKGLISKSVVKKHRALLDTKVAHISIAKLRKALLADKKTTHGNKISFIFITSEGPLVKKVDIGSVVKEYQRQIKIGSL